MIQQNLEYPGVYPNENDIIPYSPRRKFGFASGAPIDKVINLEMMKNMSIDQIVELYKEGYTISPNTLTLETHTEGLPDAPATAERQRKYGFMDITALPFENTIPDVFERERKYGFMDNTIPPGVVERWERQRKYGFTGQGSQGGITITSGAILVGVGIIALFYYMKSKGKI